jgi:hypothetical protein
VFPLLAMLNKFYVVKKSLGELEAADCVSVAPLLANSGLFKSSSAYKLKLSLQALRYLLSR